MQIDAQEGFDADSLSAFQREVQSLDATLDYAKEQFLAELCECGDLVADAVRKLSLLVFGKPICARFDPSFVHPLGERRVFPVPPHDADPAACVVAWCFFVPSGLDRLFAGWVGLYGRKRELAELAARCPRVATGQAHAVCAALGLPSWATDNPPTSGGYRTTTTRKTKAPTHRSDDRTEPPFGVVHDAPHGIGCDGTHMSTDSTRPNGGTDSVQHEGVNNDESHGTPVPAHRSCDSDSDPNGPTASPSTDNILSIDRPEDRTRSRVVQRTQKATEMGLQCSPADPHHRGQAEDATNEGWWLVSGWSGPDETTEVVISLPGAAKAAQTASQVLAAAIAETTEDARERQAIGLLAEVMSCIGHLPIPQMAPNTQPANDLYRLLLRASIRSADPARASNMLAEFRRLWPRDVSLLRQPAIRVDFPSFAGLSRSVDDALSCVVQRYELPIAAWRTLVGFSDDPIHAFKRETPPAVGPKATAAQSASEGALQSALQLLRSGTAQPHRVFRRFRLWGESIFTQLPAADDYVECILHRLQGLPADDLTAVIWAADAAIAATAMATPKTHRAAELQRLYTTPPAMLAAYLRIELRLQKLACPEEGRAPPNWVFGTIVDV